MSKGENERVHQRYSFKLPVEIRAGEQSISGETVNISIGGMLVAVSSPVAFGTTVSLKFRIPALKEDTNVDAAVRWVSGGSIGVQFLGLRAIEVWGLNQLFKHQAG
jgi:c-di-GMP-binding flagellar brake protein YcgR